MAYDIQFYDPFKNPGETFKQMAGRVDPRLGEVASSPGFQEPLDPIGSAQRQAAEYSKRVPQVGQRVPGLLAQMQAMQGRPGVSLNTAEANQVRAAQMALLAQMQQQMQGPSLAGMQGQRAMAQGGQMALRNAAMGAPGRAGMVGAAQAGAGMAGDVGQARLAEIMRSQAGMGGLASGVRGVDTRQGALAAQTGLQSQGQRDKMTAFYLSQGLDLAQAQQRANVEMESLYKQLELRNRQQQLNELKGAGQTAATILDILI